MRLIDADKLYPDVMTSKGVAISQSQIANAPGVQPKLLECDDAVSRQAVQDAIEDWLMSDDFDKRDLVQRLHGRIDELPSVQPKRNE